MFGLSLSQARSLVVGCRRGLAALLLNIVALVFAIWFSIAQPTLHPGMATMIGDIYRAIPPLSMDPYLVSIAAAIWVLIQRSNRKAFAICSMALTNMQLLAYAIGAAAGILPR